MNGIGISIAVVLIGVFNLWLASVRSAAWLGRGSWLMVIGGVALSVKTFVRTPSVVFSYVAVALLVVAMGCLVISMLKRELRVTVS